MEEEAIKAVEQLKAGNVILYPTDTIWGIGCDATNVDAVERVYGIKQRHESKSLIVLLDDADKLDHYVENVPGIAYDLIKSVTTPLTIIYSGARNLASNVVADDGTIAIRIAQDAFCKKMLALFGKAVVSTSANLSGDPAPITFSKVPDEVKRAVDHMVDHGRTAVRHTKPSTIIRLGKGGEIKVIRQ